MNWKEDEAGESREFEQALKNFKAGMDAWSDSALSRPRAAVHVMPRHHWRPVAGWALGCLLAAGSLVGGVHARVHRRQEAKLAAQKSAQKAADDRAAAAREAALQASALGNQSSPAAAAVKEDADTQNERLLATVDNEVSQSVPAAMEPLAQLMDNDDSQ